MLSVTVSEPRFKAGEVALLLASRRAENAPRGSHGVLMSEATDPANQFAIEVTPPHVDWVQSALNDAGATFEAGREKGDRRAVLFGVKRRQSFS